jgi:hypothetical protein
VTGLIEDRKREIVNDLVLIAELIFFGAAAIAVIRHMLRTA